MALLASSCDDNDFVYEPGPEPVADSSAVFFPADAPTSFTFETDDKTASFTLRRLDSHGALSVPLSYAGPEGVTVPPTAEFADGEASTTLLVDCSGVEKKVMHQCQIKIDDAFANPYVKGYTTMAFTVVASAWNLWATAADLEIGTAFYSTCDIYHLEGSRRFKIPNFLNSGLDWEFEAGTNSWEAWSGYPWLAYSIDHGYNTTVFDTNPEWTYFFDQANDGWPEFYPDSSNPQALSYFSFYNYDDYTYFVPWYESTSTPGHFLGFITSWVWLDYPDGNGAGEYLSIYLTPSYNPL